MSVLVAFASKHGSTRGIAERMVLKAVRAPEGDFRDWQAIDSWADSIAQEIGK